MEKNKSIVKKREKNKMRKTKNIKQPASKLRLRRKREEGLNYKRQFLYIRSDYILSLRIVLNEFNIPCDYYSILSDKDEAVCLIMAEGVWYVYHSERGNKYEVRIFSQYNDEDVREEMIKRLAPNKRQIKRMNMLCRRYSENPEETFNTINEIYICSLYEDIIEWDMFFKQNLDNWEIEEMKYLCVCKRNLLYGYLSEIKDTEPLKYMDLIDKLNIDVEKLGGLDWS